ncbi:hypothetical protein CHLNCDRAFT_22735 [Chlorella variabilis]|uniref:NADH dehydrogenase [ubiquinone] 1 beta subcomplex subunit 3 n=1 Tax=Chlorella variabilis TaxID=554065 RepID=E1ZDT4_CHLVA|nr:hypothetical protein CHLNCDRAFT_22735 [Chlorella variabilis]EFN55914.1 hypothetical protein CHLNCDRAFT_22735 [Chlorella variabilis]|eukprot:XP_005848016.1 hypothetical protein CHLNCDRAFT_22735 [Chlorella variabilis]
MGYNFRKADAWRQHPLLTNTWRHSMPGLGLGLVAFAAYVAYDQMTKQQSGKTEHH